MASWRATAIIYLVSSLLLFPSLPADVYAGAKKEDRRESLEDRYKKWLEEDVVYIITEEERAVFKKLTTPEEKEKFIEQFWLRRDPTPGTIENEFKEEHYRRIAYANEHFASGVPGWKTDRGRIYIMFGKPDEIESHPSGGSYVRPFWEGGGTTATYPFEIWRYRYIEGVGQDVEIEFVDTTMSGEYRIALWPWEKDALLYVPNAGLTWAEELGLAEKKDRPAFRPTANPETQGFYAMRMKDMPFQRLEQYVNLQRPPQIKFKDLQTVVTTKITYNQVPFQFRTDLLRLSSENYLVPITIELNNGDLQYKNELGIYRATVNVYGVVTALNGRIEREFEDIISSEYNEAEFQQGKTKRSIYQKLIGLKPGLYKLDLVIKDVNSGHMGTISQRIAVPRTAADQLTTSSLILASDIQPTKNLLQMYREQFVIGDLKVRPNVRSEFARNQNLNIYLQVYGVGIDQATQKPSLKIQYVILKDGQPVRHFDDPEGKTIQFFSETRVVLVNSIPISDFTPGNYKAKVIVTDQVTGKTASQEAAFKVIDTSDLRASN